MKISIDTIDGKTHEMDLGGGVSFDEFTDELVNFRFITSKNKIIQISAISAITVVEEETE
jgi:hypothetical protein